MKRILSAVLSAVLVFNTLFLLPFENMEVQAADYETTLRNKGFPESYIKPLATLHKKYPNWIFEPFKTGLDWSAAVSGERSTHSKQLIEKYSGNSSWMYCNCSKCYKNGKYVIQEASNWVSASQKAVEYYMDPRNFLNEKEIFQFESTTYNGTQTQAGVESILNGTWMYNSVISYKNKSGNTVSFKSKKYSQAFMEASNDSGLSAYYLASKVRQEVGGAKPTAGGASGTNKTYPGIYNYYNIGAYTGYLDGLKWAAVNNPAGYYTNCDCNVRQKATTSSSKIVMLKKGTAVTVKQTTSVQSDGYKWYYITASYNGKSYTGYIRSDLVSYSAGDKYNRPWISPYMTIYNGAKYIANNFKYQNTGYLQKFNVNKASKELYSHEYMANIQAAAAEAVTTYNGYNRANILSMTKSFSIPVFNNMPNDATNTSVGKVSGLKITGYTNKSVSLSWNTLSGVSGYQVQVYRSGGWTNYANTTSNKITVSGLVSCGAYLFRVRAYKTYSGTAYYGEVSSEVYQVTRANKIGNFKVTKTTDTSITMSWNSEPKVTGYRIYKYNKSTDDYEYYATVPSGTTTFTDKNLKKGTIYKYEIIGYRNYRNKMYFGYGGAGLTASTNPVSPTELKVTGYSNKAVSLSWNKVSGASGYKVQVFRSGGWTDYADTKSNKITVTGLITCGAYLFRVQAYNKVNSSKVYSGYSNEAYQVTRANKIASFKPTKVTDNSITLSWKSEPRVTGYRIYKYDKSTDDYEYYATVPSGTTTFTDKNLKKDTTYKYEIIGYRNYRNKMYFGYGGAGTSATTK